MQGILLCGGLGKRLWPSTIAVSKQLLPIYDKPLVYYPLSTLILCGVTNLVVIVTEDFKSNYQSLLGDGSEFGISIRYVVQSFPRGIPEAFTLARPYLDDTKDTTLILGDNFFYGPGLGENFFTGLSNTEASCFGYQVADPSQYGIVELDEKGQIVGLAEKPEQSKSNIAITGLYRFPSDVFNQVKFLKPSNRGELEIIDLINQYFIQHRIQFRNLPRGTAWLDTGSPNGLLGASNFVQLLQDRQNLLIGSPHESAWRKGRISAIQLAKTINKFEFSTYGHRLESRINGQA